MTAAARFENDGKTGLMRGLLIVLQWAIASVAVLGLVTLPISLETQLVAGIDPASITTMAATHAHEDHVSGLLTPAGRALLPRLEAIVIGEDAVKGFLAKTHLAAFRVRVQHTPTRSPTLLNWTSSSASSRKA